MKEEINELKEYREKLSKLSEEEIKKRNIYLKKLADGTIEGPQTGFPEIDIPWLGMYEIDEILEDVPKKTIWQYTLDCLKEENNLKIINYYGNIVTWGELKNKVNDVANKLVNKYNIKKGDKISLCLPIIPEIFYLFFALNKIGAIANMIDPRINEERIKDCIGKDSKLVFSVDIYNEKIDNVTKKLDIGNVVSISPSNSLPKDKKILYNLKVKTKKVDRFVKWQQFMKTNVVALAKESEYMSNQPAAIVYTSGTTGIPKGAILSNDSINAVSFQQKKVLPDMKKGDTFLDIMPPFLAYGLVCGICAPASTGLYLTLIPKFEPQKFDKLVLKNKSNHILGVPTFFESLTKSKIIKNKSLSFIKYCIAGGDKMTVESEKNINEFFQKHGIKNNIVKGYGMTELSSGVFINKDNQNNKLGSCGTPLFKNKVKVVDLKSGKNLTYNQIGELYVSGPSEMLGYANNSEEEYKVKIKDEYDNTWIKTGDLGHVDEKGNVTLDGRIKNMIVRHDGHNVFPKPIEDIILTHPAVEQCVVIGIRSEEYLNGKLPTACIVLKDEYKGKEDKIVSELTKKLLEKLPPRDIALDYKFMDQFLITPNGKIDINGLVEMYESKNKGKVK